ncbi:hypothetical protein ACFL39_02335 [Gemmatimonadota bacterium]
MDLDRLTRSNPADEELISRGLNPATHEDPDALFRKLVLLYASDLSTTGWDWRGDLALAFGLPNHIAEFSHTVYYAFGEPAAYQIISGMLGKVLAIRSTGPIERYTRDLQDMITAERSESRTAVDNLLALIPEAATVSDSLISQLNRLIPPSSTGVEYSNYTTALDISADVVSFPNRDGSLDIFISLGIPYKGISTLNTPSGLRAKVETCCVLYNNAGELVEWELHNEGFSTGNPEDDIETLWLVDSFNILADPDEYILYCSVRDPLSGLAVGRLFLLDLNVSDTFGPVISPIALAAAIEPGESEHGFTRGGYELLLYPGRNLLFRREILLYTEIDKLQRSDYGSYSWMETYYVLPAQEDMGIISFSSGAERTQLSPRAERYIEVDLSSLEGQYSGPIYIVIMITDTISGRSALAAAFFQILNPQ